MTIQNSLAPQIKELLSTLSTHGQQHLNEIENDLVQTNLLLSEAIDKLGGSFMAIHAAVVAQQHLVNVLLENGSTPKEAVAELREKAGQIDLHVNAAVTGLQFQDMTNQLNGRTMRRVVGFRDVLAILGAAIAGIAMDENNDKMSAKLGTVNETLNTENAILENELWKAVRQTHMESGDIELF